MPKKQNRSSATLSFTATEIVALPADEEPSMGIRSRDWKSLRKSVGRLSSSNNVWEIAFTISTTVFFSFLIPSITTPGSLSGWRLTFTAVTVFSFGVALTSFSVMLSEKRKKQTDRQDVLELMDEIESLYNPASNTNLKSAQETGYVSGEAFDTTYPRNDDDLYEAAKQLALELGQISTSSLQRRLSIGYGRAARVIDRMEREGIIGEMDGARPRSVLLNIRDNTTKSRSVVEK